MLHTIKNSAVFYFNTLTKRRNEKALERQYFALISLNMDPAFNLAFND